MWHMRTLSLKKKVTDKNMRLCSLGNQESWFILLFKIYLFGILRAWVVMVYYPTSHLLKTEKYKMQEK